MIERFVKNRDIIPEKVLRQLINLSLGSFGSGMNPQEVRRHIVEPGIVFVSYEKNEAIGFSSMNLCSESFYLAGSAVKLDKQNNGCYHDLLRCRFDEGLAHNLMVINTRTQNPIIEHSLRNIIKKNISLGKLTSYNISRSIDIACYGRMLTKSRPLSKDDSLNRLYDVLDYDRGDAFSMSVKLL